jgi:hypothetical protein|tara:strand:+ start:660 stop:884 length:225 start_codon:yes stop_codon:yes gene_type:complete
MADMKKLMEHLHNTVGEELLRRIETGEATSADLSVARQFLKDNGIDATLNQSEPLANLATILPFDPEETVGEVG